MNSTDLLVRLQLMGCKYGELLNDYVNGLKYGKKNLTCLKWKLLLLNVYIEIVECYDLNSENNCFTEDELKQLFDDVSSLTGLCFQPYGYSYKDRR